MLQAFTYENGQPRRLGPTESPRNAVWIDLLSPTPDEIARVQDAIGMTLPERASLDEIEMSSRLASRDGALFLSLPLITLAEGPRAIAAGFILTADRLISQRFAPSRAVDSFMEKLPPLKDHTARGGHVFIGLLEALVDRQADRLEQVRTELEEISGRIFAMGVRGGGGRKTEDALLRRTLGELGQHGQLISHIREVQVTVGRIAPFVEEMTKDWLPADLGSRLKTVRDDITSLNDYDTHLNDRLQFLMDATLGFINIAQNNVMKVMTIASVVGIPPVLVAGVYGMNFKNIPEYDWAWGYQWGWGLIVVTTFIPLLIFRFRKWI